VENVLREAGVDSGLRGEQLSLQDFVAIAEHAEKVI
jgi:16S rRNA A1518/A1519 N6-dimethyltransferase RsmA/KsgA/DIM1 with predicted DNA glycosylase/AP lyase activity